MTENTPDPPPPPPNAIEDPQTQKILISEFVEFLAKKPLKLTCSSCNSETFSPVSLPDNTTAAQLHLQVAMGYVPALGAICNNCGHIDLFYWQTVHRWVKDRDKKDG